MTSETSQTVKCVECFNEINVLAVKCSYCGAYQDWRRYVPFGHSTLALIISLIAVISVVIPDPKSPIKKINDYLSGTNSSFSAALVDMNIDNISVLVENIENTPAALNNLTCVLALPFNRAARSREYLKSRNDGTESNYNRPFTVSETMGSFQLHFNLDNPILLKPYKTSIITFSTARIYAPLRPEQPRVPTETIINFCALSGTNIASENPAVALFEIRPNQLTNIDLLEVIERAYYEEQRQHERERDMGLVHDTRDKAQNPENTKHLP